MEKDKITYIKEKQIQKKSNENLEFFENQFVQNPIKAKFLAFKQTKEELKKDLTKEFFD